MVDISDNLKNVFNKWDARIFVVVSLLFQVLLILLAPWRKRSASKILIFLIWSSYLLADWVAGFTLGLLVQSQGGSDCDATAAKGNIIHDDDGIVSTSKHKLCHSYHDNLLAFWAPFLLLHLGGPDNITAFSMEDNALWKRHLVGLLFQVGTAVYVVLLSLPHNRLLAPTILMFLAGNIKYFERTYALYCASLDVFRDSFLTQGADDVQKTGVKELSEDKNYNTVILAYKLLRYSKSIILDQSTNFEILQFTTMRSTAAFNLVEWELSFVYDELFTKASVVHACVGYALRFLCSSLILAASILFFLSSKLDFTRLDVCITYVLLAGAISLDILAYFMLIFSKWTIVRLKEFESRSNLSRPLEIICPIIFKVISTSNEWSRMMMQHNLINSCLHQHRSHMAKNLHIMARLFDDFGKKLFDYTLESTWSETITDELMEFIFQCMKNKYANCIQENDYDRVRKLLTSRGNLPLERMDEVLRRSVEVRFERSILIWHIATDLCYYTEDERTTDQEHQNLMNVSKLISNYMLYLLFMRLSMMPSVKSWHQMYRDTCEDIKKKLSTIPTQKEQNQLLKEVCKFLVSVPELDFLYEDGESVLKGAVDTATKIKDLEDQERWSKVAEVWADMLQYAANNCPGMGHVQALNRGGELLTSVCFLLSHYGLGIRAADISDFPDKDSHLLSW